MKMVFDHFKTVDILIFCFIIHIECFRMQDGASALMIAALCGHPDCIEALVKCGANVDIQEENVSRLYN